MADATRLKALKTNRTTIKSSCTRVQTYLSSVNDSEVAIIELRQRLQKALALWDSFNNVQTQIEELEDDALCQAGHQEERECFESRYFAVTVALETLINQKESELRRAQELPNLQDLREGTPISHANSVANDHLKLPRVTMATFTGRYEEWIPFKNIFLSMIHQNPTLPNTQKMQYLLSVLKGEAHDVVSSLETSDENYSEAWQMLKDRYDDDNLIIQRHIRTLFDLPVMNKENHVALRRMLDTVLKHLRALKALKRPTDQWDDLMIHLVTSRLDQTTTKEWEISVKKGEIPRFEQLTDFLAQRCRAVEAAARTQRTTSCTTHQGKSEHNKNTMAHVGTTNVMCSFCGKEDHLIYKCNGFLQLGVEQRIKEAQARKICLNCLKIASHRAKQCGAGACRRCGKRHNTLLHLEQVAKIQPESVSASTPNPENEGAASSSVSLAAVRHERQVLLSTAVINAIGLEGKPMPCRALLDCGSQSCFVTTDCVKKLGLKQIATSIPISGLAGLSTQSRKLAKIMIKSRINCYQTNIDCLVIEKITQSLPANSLNLGELQIPDGITLADPQFNQSSAVDLLIGAEIFFDLLCIGKIKLAEDQPTWQKTVFGWIASGRFMTRNGPRQDTWCHLATNDDLNANLSRFWQIECSERQDTRTPEERLCEGQFAQSYKRNSEGRFIVTLPTRDELLLKMGDSRETALQRFKTLERKLEQRPRLKEEYSAFIHEYANLKHMRELSANSPDLDVRPHFYLPHHCVIKETSVTTKLRVVFDASCKTTSGISLNDALMVGPVLQQDLFAILLRFRSFKYALTADIAKMYRQVLVDESQVPLQRILWRDDPNENIKTFELLTLTYGTAPASFLATKVIHQLAELEDSNFPIGAAIARRDFYVDDLISGANSREDALIIRDQTTALLKKGGFVLRQWASNDTELLDSMPELSTTSAVLELDKDGTSKTLGVKWNPSKDVLQYAISMKASRPASHTKRSILSSIAQIFDPLGLLGPVIVVAKILIQRLWKLQINWDESLPSDIHTEWSNYVMMVQTLNEFSVRRKIIDNDSDEEFELHGFCDASERAYGACVYVRGRSASEDFRAQLLCSKSRVAPLKTLSIPRLELCGAQVLTQLMDKVRKALGLNITKTCYWTDSAIVLHWIKASNKKLPVFVAHRVGEIQESTASEDWHHVATNDNPADLISRGVSPEELMRSQLWWNGPQWLREHDIKYSPETPNVDETQLMESAKATAIVLSTQRDVNPFDRFSTLNKLLRVTATCLRVARICRKQRIIGPLTVDELECARRRLVQREQQSAFGEEINAFRKGDEIPKGSRLRGMSPFIDEDGLLRVGGRLEHTEIHRDAKHPVLLPHRSRLTELVILDEHQKNLHTGVEGTLAAVRQSYWPLRARSIIKQLIRNCVTCFKARPRISEQVMGNLPSHRVTLSRPFNSSGVDFCGPITIRDGKRRNSKHIKAYVAVFVCMATTAVHFEVVSDLTTDAFLHAFKRFINRRGKPADVFSDNGKNFVGANRELRELGTLFEQEEHQNKIIDCSAPDRIRWHFIPPRAPHFGGLWEAAVKSLKRHFYKVASNVALTFEESSTLVTHVEAILNSRPLTAISADPNDFNYLTAGHFLIGTSITAYAEPSITDVKTNRLSRWQHLEQLRQHFWKRWSSEYLLQLQRRSKWQTNQGPQLRTGQLVVCREDGLPPLKWALGRVQELFPGTDGIVRTANIKTATGVFKRPATKLCILPLDTSSNEVKV